MDPSLQAGEYMAEYGEETPTIAQQEKVPKPNHPRGKN
jgi:hypothetical protein